MNQTTATAILYTSTQNNTIVVESGKKDHEGIDIGPETGFILISTLIFVLIVGSVTALGFSLTKDKNIKD